MSQQKTKTNKSKAREKRKQRPKAVAGPPKQDPTRVRASLAQLTEVHRQAIGGLTSLRQEVANNFAQVHGNHEELLQGLNASEFNLRAHQKVLNAMAMELERIAKALELDPPLEVLQMADVPVAPQQGDELQQTVRRIDWPGYHSEVEADLKRIAEIEKQRAEAQKKAAEEEAQRLREESEKAKAEAEAKDKEEAQQEAAPPPQDEDQDVPEGATVFGGDV
jgi:hypothetical protein